MQILGEISENRQQTGEVPIGVLNGVNVVFTTLYPFVPESVEFFLNGQRLKNVEDYSLTGGTTITLIAPPDAGEDLLVDYTKG